MAIYRALVPLSKGETVIPLGGFIRDGQWPAAVLSQLERMGKLAHIAPPPLAQLPGWKLRAQKMERIGVMDAEQFLEAGDEWLSQSLEAKPELIAKWKMEVSNLLTIPQPQG